MIQPFLIFSNFKLSREIKQRTNLYASQQIRDAKQENAVRRNSLFQLWKTFTLVDLKKFFAIVLRTSVLKKPQLRDYWSTNPVLHSSFAKSMMSRDRFRAILSFLHINDNTNYVSRNQSGYDPLFKVRPFVDHLQATLKDVHSPGKELTIDEQICPFRGQINIRVYAKGKPHKLA